MSDVASIKGTLFWDHHSLSYTLDRAFYNGNSLLSDALGGAVTSVSNGDALRWEAALAIWSSFLPLSFTPTAQPLSADLGLMTAQITDSAGYNFVGLTQSFYYVGTPHFAFAGLFVEPNEWPFVYQHELGHALGLDHPGHAQYGDTTHLTTNATIMSYILGTLPGSGLGVVPVTPMALDIAALQEVYGRPATDHIANTYTLSGAWQAWTIWDNGGIDTLRAISSAGNSATINLRAAVDAAGIWSNAYSKLGQELVYVARDANIENAIAGAGHDILVGNQLNNSLWAGAGDDRMRGGDGNDTMRGEDGNDTFYGEAGHDWLYAGYGHDRVDGGNGNDRLDGNRGDDRLMGGRGTDIIKGGDGADFIEGGDDDDRLWGGHGDDVMTGGTGADKFLFTSLWGREVITDFAYGIDKLFVEGFAIGTIALALTLRLDADLDGNLDDAMITGDNSTTQAIVLRDFHHLNADAGTPTLTVLAETDAAQYAALPTAFLF